MRKQIGILQFCFLVKNVLHPPLLRFELSVGVKKKYSWFSLQPLRAFLNQLFQLIWHVAVILVFEGTCCTMIFGKLSISYLIFTSLIYKQFNWKTFLWRKKQLHSPAHIKACARGDGLCPSYCVHHCFCQRENCTHRDEHQVFSQRVHLVRCRAQTCDFAQIPLSYCLKI